MSNEGFKLQVSVKDTDGDMVNVRADSPEELSAYLTAFPVGEYAQFKANVRGGSSLGTIVQPQAPQAPAQQPQWAASAPATQPQWSQPQRGVDQPVQGGGNHPSAQLHPEGKACDQCGTTLEHKKTQGGKAKWQCPQWRWNGGNPNGHSMEWVN